MKKMKTKILIYVSGGVVQKIEATEDVEIDVFDVDNFREKYSSEKVQEKWEKIRKSADYNYTVY